MPTRITPAIRKSMSTAAAKGAAAGHPATLPLWRLSRRELIELAIYSADNAINPDRPGDRPIPDIVNTLLTIHGILKRHELV